MTPLTVNMTIPTGLLASVQEGLEDSHGGEIVVKQGSRCGRIFVCNGKIAWVTCTSVPKRLREILIDAADLNEQDLDEVLRESKATGRGFAEILHEWNLLEMSTIRRCLLTHNAQSFQGIVSFGEQMNSMFIPQRMKCSNEFLYTLQEILGKFRSQSAKVAIATQKQLKLSKALLKVTNKIPGIVWVAIAETTNSQLIAKWPEDNEPGDLRAVMKACNEQIVHNPNLQMLDRALGGSSNGGSYDVVMLDEDVLHLALRLDKEHFALLSIEGTQNLALGLSKGKSALSEMLRAARGGVV